MLYSCILSSILWPGRCCTAASLPPYSDPIKWRVQLHPWLEQLSSLGLSLGLHELCESQHEFILLQWFCGSRFSLGPGFGHCISSCCSCSITAFPLLVCFSFIFLRHKCTVRWMVRCIARGESAHLRTKVSLFQHTNMNLKDQAWTLFFTYARSPPASVHLLMLCDFSNLLCSYEFSSISVVLH